MWRRAINERRGRPSEWTDCRRRIAQDDVDRREPRHPRRSQPPILTSLDNAHLLLGKETGMNDVAATGFAILVLYLVVRFAFGGASSHPQQHGQGHAPLSPARANAAPHAPGFKASSSAVAKQTLISRFGLEDRIKQQEATQDSHITSSSSAAAAEDERSSPSLTSSPASSAASKGKGKMTDDEWKAGAERRRDELRRRKEEMILEARKCVQDPATICRPHDANTYANGKFVVASPFISSAGNYWKSISKKWTLELLSALVES